jgi:hypothetical protein
MTDEDFGDQTFGGKVSAIWLHPEWRRRRLPFADRHLDQTIQDPEQLRFEEAVRRELSGDD